MKSKHSLTTLLMFIFVIVLTILACRKNDLHKVDDNDQLTERFFKAPNVISSELSKVIEQLKKQNNQYKFLPSFIKTNGLPVWKNVISNETLFGYRNSNQRNASGSDSLMFFIPLQSLTSSEIGSYIVCLKTDTSYRFSLYRKNVLDTLTSSNKEKRKFFKSALSVFALFEKQINGKDSILIGGNYQKYVSRASLTFGNADSSSGRASRSDFYAYGVTTCYKISCTEQQSARTSIVFDCYYCNTYWSISWGGGSSSNSYWFDDGSGGGNSGGGSSGGSSYSPTVQNLIYLLNLSSSQADWLSYNEQRAIEILYYLQTTPTYLEEAKQISVQHINEMMNNNWYLTFVQMYVQNAQSNLVW